MIFLYILFIPCIVADQTQILNQHMHSYDFFLDIMLQSLQARPTRFDPLPGPSSGTLPTARITQTRPTI